MLSVKEDYVHVTATKIALMSIIFYYNCFLYTESNVFPFSSFHTNHPLLLLPIQKSAAVLGLENILSEFITQFSFSKVAYSLINFSRFSFHWNDGTQLFANILPFRTVKPDEL